MKKFGLIASALTISVFLAGYSINASHAADQTSPKTQKDETASTKKQEAVQQNAAIVNGKPIPMSEYQTGLNQLNQRISMSGKKPDEKEMSTLKQNILDSLIGRELLSQEATKRGIKADDTEVNAQLSAFKKRGTPEQFADSLKQMKLTESSFKDLISSQMAIRKLIDQDVISKIVVTPEEVKAFYDSHLDMFKTPETVRASHILVKVDKTATDEEKAKALEKIKGVQKRIQNGEDFAAVAKEVSDCPSKEKGGDLDFFTKEQMVPPFANAAFSMKPGDTSDIVETQFGYHIIRVTDKKEPGTMSFDEAKSSIEQIIKKERTNEEVHKYIESFKSKAKIQVLVKN